MCESPSSRIRCGFCCLPPRVSGEAVEDLETHTRRPLKSPFSLLKAPGGNLLSYFSLLVPEKYYFDKTLFSEHSFCLCW